MVYLHISDLHMGVIDPTKPGGWNAPTPRYTQTLKLLTGQWGHHFRALEALQEFYDRLVASEGEVQLIMSGDATSFGKAVEFEVANAFLAGSLNSRGLGLKGWRDLAIPGNHDHWPGSRRIVGRPTKGLHKYFPKDSFPYWTPPQRLTSQHTLRFIAINTDADVRSFGPSRLHARGVFHNQLVELDNRLPSQISNEIRVLLLHHSPLFDKPAYRADLSMRARSADALEQCLVNHGISVVMCGHTHAAAAVKPFTAKAPNGLSREVIECCCGTTTQRDRIPSNFKTPTGKFPNWKLDPNTLLVHRFENNTAGRVELLSQAHVLVPSGFATYGQPTRHVLG